MAYIQLIVNPGSTSTKLAFYRDDKEIASSAQPFSARPGTELIDQMPARLQSVRAFLRDQNVSVRDLDAVMCRGGLVWGIGTGAYRVNDALASALADEKYTTPHASALGGIIGKAIADEAGVSAYIYDAVTAASLPDFARITGFPDIVRNSSCHVLNMRAMALRYAKDIQRELSELRLIVVHMGGGISTSAFEDGEIIDSIGDDDGPFSPERSGFTQIDPIVKLCYSGKYTYKQMQEKMRGSGGLKAYLGTSDAREIEKMIEAGDQKAALLYRAQAYQISKSIGELSIVHKGHTDAIILTGGLAYSKRMTDMISEYTKFLAPICIYPGEHEMQALAEGGLRILRGEEKAKEFVLADAIRAARSVFAEANEESMYSAVETG